MDTQESTCHILALILLVVVIIIGSTAYYLVPQTVVIKDGNDLANHIANLVSPVDGIYGEVDKVLYGGREIEKRPGLSSEQFANFLTIVKGKKISRQGEGEIILSSSKMHHVRLFTKRGSIKLIVSEMDFQGLMAINFTEKWRTYYYCYDW